MKAIVGCVLLRVASPSWVGFGDVLGVFTVFSHADTTMQSYATRKCCFFQRALQFPVVRFARHSTQLTEERLR